MTNILRISQMKIIQDS